MRRFAAIAPGILPRRCALQFRLAANYKSAHVGSGVTVELPPSPVGGSCSDESPAPVRKLSPLQKRQLAMKDKKAFALTPTAVYRIKTLLVSAPDNQAQEKALGIRIGVKKRGCSGYSYTVNYEYPGTQKPTDVHVEQSDVYVYVEGDALFYVIGTEMDYVTSNVEEKFAFKNPNQKALCGCGDSFMM